MDADAMKTRTRSFALRTIKLCASLPRNDTSQIIARQLLRSATSVGANYRAACKSRSPAEFSAKIGLVEEEADESAYWIELLVDAKLMQPARVAALLKEAKELTAIAAASRITTRRNSRRAPMKSDRQLPIGNRKSAIGNSPPTIDNRQSSRAGGR